MFINLSGKLYRNAFSCWKQFKSELPDHVGLWKFFYEEKDLIGKQFLKIHPGSVVWVQQWTVNAWEKKNWYHSYVMQSPFDHNLRKPNSPSFT